MTYFDLIPRNPVCPAAGQCRWTGQENRKQKNRKLKPLVTAVIHSVIEYSIYIYIYIYIYICMYIYIYIYRKREREERYSCTRWYYSYAFIT